MSDFPVLGDPPWRTRVKFDRAGGFAYVPNVAFVRDSPVDDSFIPDLRAEGDTFDFIEGPMTGFRAIGGGEFDAIRVVAELRAKGFDAQPDHVLFAHDMTCCCCGPHPATCFDPFFLANPLHANPLHANPLHANPLHANPLHANSADANGPTRSSARPADPPDWYSTSASTSASDTVPGTPHVVVLDTGLAGDIPAMLRDALDVTGAGYPEHRRCGFELRHLARPGCWARHVHRRDHRANRAGLRDRDSQGSPARGRRHRVGDRQGDQRDRRAANSGAVGRGGQRAR